MKKRLVECEEDDAGLYLRHIGPDVFVYGGPFLYQPVMMPCADQKAVIILFPNSDQDIFGKLP